MNYILFIVPFLFSCSDKRASFDSTKAKQINLNTQQQKKSHNPLCASSILKQLNMTEYCDPYKGGDIGLWLENLVLNSDPLRLLQKNPKLMFQLLRALRNEAKEKNWGKHSNMTLYNDAIAIVFKNATNNPIVKKLLETEETNHNPVSVKNLFSILDHISEHAENS